MVLMNDARPRSTQPDEDPEAASLRARLRSHLLAHLPEAGDHVSALPGLALYRRDSPTEPASMLYEPSVGFVVQGRKRVVLGSDAYEYDAAKFVLTTMDLPTISHVLEAHPGRPCLSMMLKLDFALVQAVGGEIDLQGIAVTDDTESGMAFGHMPTELLDAFVRLLALADKPRDIAIMAPLVLREITYRLLMAPSGGHLRRIARQDPRYDKILTAIAWLREHYAEAIRIEALAEVAAMGVSTLHHHFSAITHMSPLQYQKHIRLHEARRLLLTERLDATSAAYRVGYESVTQFSREYRRLFGNPPIRDISLLRGDLKEQRSKV
ncbi:AraC family transcriptional regulator [Variovorax sp. ZS18.2.2]|uniref:AraC family transcriptional regulator n=1 Tax=Variovorax sp. ZS18.2.2 TaxID=2971255 RepID=UPI0021508999|nr:AraC family transcriptional regulator [Variovorax sp. ZS18.2.2]MCR6476106.1 AraC family transcriptional regulator [Variovorax sp. ZS18.2.2]